jgi:hypothetical protein
VLELDGINYLAVAVVWLIYVVAGAFWYSPMGFAKQWSRESGVNIMEMPQDQATRIIGFVVVSAVVQVFALAIVLNSLGVTEVADGLLVGVVLWAGFTAATTVGNTLYQGLGWGFWLINNAYFLLVMAVGSVILAIW